MVRKRIFVVHEHRARRLHYDLRLELTDAKGRSVLKSWAIPKQPPQTAGIKRLAIQVEDHPLSYASFQGRIPEGMYGAGLVKIWDSGKYELKEKTENKIIFDLKGKKLKGTFCLIKFKNQDKAKTFWLFFKK